MCTYLGVSLLDTAGLQNKNVQDCNLHHSLFNLQLFFYVNTPSLAKVKKLARPPDHHSYSLLHILFVAHSNEGGSVK